MMTGKKNDGIKESTDSSTTIEDEDTRGKELIPNSLPLFKSIK